MNRLYEAETLVHGLFDHAARSSAHTVDCLGITLTLPPEARFASVESVQRYVDDVLVRVGGPGAVRVRARAGATQAHYEPDSAVIAVPAGRDGRWALRELVVLHELAHHLAPRGTQPHGPEFASTLIELARAVMGPEAGLALEVVLRETGVPVG
ncbi:TIGR04338 family metallohydrolase [Tsukamurella sp. 8F]|uniref:TIGR04338 family metallohydrolase n=1 Tax=unclassified Tsukamurella TaxID=2633480 RepID=UPI0023B89839|nr:MULTISPECIES: TIGR04338 family metallohydrolase [unclassified Tsukamurella]MDF0532504.1 TIGR04338 family metallohydrolase [Tsukamurella sp. 8J]MDF0588904.1 TIGR04338 family metallohydrolase [Tsukamurella sp. 8F]